MLIMAIGALDELFVHPMPEGFPEFRGSLQVAGVTEGGLLLREQKLLLLGEMGRMAVNTAHIISTVLGTLEIDMLLAVFVAGQAARAAFSGGDILKIKDPRRISSPSHMLPPPVRGILHTPAKPDLCEYPTSFSNGGSFRNR